MVYITNSDKETLELAHKLAQGFKTEGGIILLRGDLGAGKTTFTQGFAKALGIKEKIISPTFVLIRQHKINPDKTLFHIDLYRLEKVNPTEIGITEMVQNNQNILLVEWPERLSKELKSDLKINFKIISPTKRQIHVV